MCGHRQIRNVLTALWLAFGCLFPLWASADAPTGIRPSTWPQEPSSTLLLQNRPNPVSKSTVIFLFLAQSGRASLALYNDKGVLVGYFFNGLLKRGWYSVKFSPDFITVGQYYYRLLTPDRTLLAKMIVMR
jgi:hypothetical protein